jgi:hypothetical protein
MSPRPLEELINIEEPVWPVLERELLSGSVPVEILPIAERDGASALYRIQVTVRSCLGALALHTGGVLVDHGWVRVLGGGAVGLPGLADANGLPQDPAEADEVPNGFVVGHDVVGGVFTLNGSDPASAGRPGEPGQMCYFAPDTLEWEAMEIGHGAWLQWLVSGRLAQFYEGLRWQGWEAEARDLALDQGISVYPFLWTEEARRDLAATSRRPVPIAELFGINEDFAEQFADVPESR